MKSTIKRALSLPEAKLNKISQSILSGRIALMLFLFDIFLGISGFMYLEGYNLVEAFYMVVITVSTVGYTEVRPLSDMGHLFASLYIILNIGLFAYLLSVFSYYVVNGELFKRMYHNIMRKNIQQLNGHVIICGHGRYGKEMVQHFLLHKMPFVVIEQNPEVLEEIQLSDEKILYVQGDATTDEALVEARLPNAKALIAALPDDSENLYVVLTARQLNPNLNIISRANSQRSIKKLKLAGADHVIMPEQIGGFYMATLVSKPGATEFFSRISRENEADILFEEISYDKAPASCKNKSIRELHIRQHTGTNIIGYITPAGSFQVNPSPDTVLEPGSSFIVIGSNRQIEKLRQFLKNMG
ncbi:MAG: potassium channel protein [Saprospiraceae bacterium]|jgi:voltage-gated potassium channel